MTFANIPNGTQVFIDANPLVYHAVADPTHGLACKQLIERVARGEIDGYTSAHAVYDMAHRVMTIEAMAQFGWPAKGIGTRLRQFPQEVRKLTRYLQAVANVPQMGIKVLPVDFDLVLAATALSNAHGLLTGDALVVATMNRHGVSDLASLDADFDRVPTIKRHTPV